ncbi:lipid droplet-regulating VLDL assembly factor AUP1 [Bufo gargarizans]|uniref:lipid droplet-regulating VLDL assembly factor AUP1 n=1 Tax=Bufo gargarizans TaxID=30331 RepID=UPI001CF52149|nr:lipid droplet-regulating VLDL assembly factor AUP1 [Bufo gargarizans]XP_044130549.1 lipid droplet-regulating VLDL assembly factor AUP1 [Bufo gargarizans]
MEQPGLEQMLDGQRFPVELLSRGLLLLYAPLGLCLFLLRLFIGAHVFLVSCVLPDCAIRRFLVRVMCSVLGVIVSQSGEPDRALKIFVSNHFTFIDHNVLSLLTSCSTPSVSCPPGFLCWARGFLELGAPGSQTQLQESLKHFLSQTGSSPLLLFPEEETTNGRAGLLHFSSWAFSLSDSVQPVALRVSRPLVSVAVPGSPWCVELFWTLFSLYTVYHVRWLLPVYRSPRESDKDFASRVQKLLAHSLGVHGTKHTAADRAEHMKRRRKEPPPRSRHNPPTASTASSHMAQRVKEVLPQVPLSVIHQDLALTGCVDATITNLIEGRVPYEPEAESAGSEAPGCTASNKLIPRGFARRPEDRHLSLQERKEALYDCARRRYLEKYGGVAAAKKKSD